MVVFFLMNCVIIVCLILLCVFVIRVVLLFSIIVICFLEGESGSGWW